MTITADEFFGKDLKVYDTKKVETIQTLKEDIAILQEKLQKLEEIEKHKTRTPAEAYEKVFGHPPECAQRGVWFGFQQGFEAAQK